jgi:hypothetical protein
MTQHNVMRLNDIQRNETQHNEIQLNEIQHNETQHNNKKVTLNIRTQHNTQHFSVNMQTVVYAASCFCIIMLCHCADCHYFECRGAGAG